MESKLSLSVIDSVEISDVERVMQKITNFQKVVKKQLKQNQDFGIIPGTPKPTLLKPGAEKILMLLGLRSTFEIIDSTRNFDKGFFQYQVKCTLFKGDALITEGLGAANCQESKYAKMNPYTIDNTMLKMAKKRALVDAALLVGSLSDIFTQDIEDMDLQGDRVSAAQQAKKQEKEEPKLTQEQKDDAELSRARKALYAKSKELGFTHDEVKSVVITQFGVDSTKAMTKPQIIALIDYMEAAAKNKEKGEKTNG